MTEKVDVISDEAMQTLAAAVADVCSTAGRVGLTIDQTRMLFANMERMGATIWHQGALPIEDAFITQERLNKFFDQGNIYIAKPKRHRSR